MTYGTSWPKVTLITRYFLASDEKLKAWLLLFFGLLCTLVTTVTIILFPWLFALIWSALAGIRRQRSWSDVKGYDDKACISHADARG